MSESKRPQNLQTSFSISLDPETLKTVSLPKHVRLYHSTLSSNFLYPGKIQIPESSCDTLLWTYPKNLQKSSIPLAMLKSGRIMTGSEAQNFIDCSTTNGQDVEEDKCLVLAYSEVFCIVFEETDHCQKWIKALRVLLKALNLQVSCEEWKSEPTSLCPDYNYLPEQYGAIFDISESDDQNDDWQFIKITFVKEDTSQTEHLSFDKTQKDLRDSANEVLVSVESFLDVVNQSILSNYLNDIVRIETIKRTEAFESVKVVRTMLPPGLKMKRKENTQIRGAYAELKATEVGSRLIKMLKDYERDDFGDRVADALGLVYMQKLGIAVDLHQLACEHQIMAMRRSLELAVPAEEVKTKQRQSDSPSNTERRISNIINKKASPKEEKSFFRDACECLVV